MCLNHVDDASSDPRRGQFRPRAQFSRAVIAGSGLLGVGAAASWGVGDFAARFLGRAIGVPQALFGMMLVGSLAVGVYIVASGETLVLEPSGLWLLALNGVATMLATFMLFEALTRGPVSLGSPMVSSYPAFAVPMTVVFGARPEPIHWVAMGATLGGIWLVALAVSRIEGGDKPEYAPAVLRRSVLMAIGSAFFFAVALLAADEAIERYGLPLTLLSGRIVGAVVLGASFLVMRKVPRMPLAARVAADRPPRPGGHPRLHIRLRWPRARERRVRDRRGGLSALSSWARASWSCARCRACRSARGR